MAAVTCQEVNLALGWPWGWALLAIFLVRRAQAKAKSWQVTAATGAPWVDLPTANLLLPVLGERAVFWVRYSTTFSKGIPSSTLVRPTSKVVTNFQFQVRASN